MRLLATGSQHGPFKSRRTTLPLQQQTVRFSIREKQTSVMGSHQLRKLRASRDYILANYPEDFTLSSLAEHSNLSSYHFLRTFKKTYGRTPNEFLIRLRIEEAKKLLITGNLSVSEVCQEVGYLSLGSFSSLFLKQVGMSPSHYRRKLWALSKEPFRFPSQAIPACYALRFGNKKSN